MQSILRITTVFCGGSYSAALGAALEVTEEVTPGHITRGSSPLPSGERRRGGGEKGSLAQDARWGSCSKWDYKPHPCHILLIIQYRPPSHQHRFGHGAVSLGVGILQLVLLAPRRHELTLMGSSGSAKNNRL